MTHTMKKILNAIYLFVFILLAGRSITAIAQKPILTIKPTDHMIVAWYIKASRHNPVGFYADTWLRDKNKRKISSIKPDCYLKKDTRISIQQQSNGYALVMPLAGKCIDKVRRMKLDKLSRIKYHYTFDKTKKHNAWTIILPEYYKQVEEFNEAKGVLQYKIVGEDPAAYTLLLYKGGHRLSSRYYNFHKLRAYPCGCVSFILEIFYQNKFFHEPDYSIPRKIVKRPLLHWIKYYRATGKPVNPDGPHAEKYIILQEKKLLTNLLQVSAIMGNGSPDTRKDRLIQVIGYYHGVNKVTQRYVGAKEYWQLLTSGVRL